MGTKMFQFPTFPSIHYFTYVQIHSLFLLCEFPHSDICGLLDICSSPQLFAAYHVLLRLLVPRHSPYALCSLTFWLRLNFALLVYTVPYLFSVSLFYNFSMFNIASLLFFGWIVILNWIFSYSLQYASLPSLFSLYNFQCTCLEFQNS